MYPKDPSHPRQSPITRKYNQLHLQSQFLLDNAVETAGSSPVPDGNKPLALIGDVIMRLVLRLHAFERDCSRGEVDDLGFRVIAKS